MMLFKIFKDNRASGCTVKGLAGDWRVAGSNPETIDFLTNSSGQAINALVSLFTKQCKLVPAS